MEPARKFRIIVNSKECGTCSGSSPSTVAKKVVKKLCGSSSKVVKFSLKECKRGCERVCGPYQGRMEKLDRPCKRDGKTITHRVVCGKVRKMKGGKISRTGVLDESDFVCDTEEDRVKRHVLTRKPYIFFGKDPSNKNNNEMKYVAYNKKIDGVKTALFKEFVILSRDHIHDISIKKISVFAIDELVDFLDKIRERDPKFCQTIYKAATDEKKIYDEEIKALQKNRTPNEGQFAEGRIKGVYNLNRTRK
jgi:hypothetical protein